MVVGRRAGSVQEQLDAALPVRTSQACSACGQTRFVSTHFAGVVLAVSINRFSRGASGQYKLSAALPLDTTVELLPADSSARVAFDLVAVSQHDGRSTNKGHYKTFIRLQGEDWAVADDADVTAAKDVVREEKLAARDVVHSASIAFYCRRSAAHGAEARSAQPSPRVSLWTSWWDRHTATRAGSHASVLEAPLGRLETVGSNFSDVLDTFLRLAARGDASGVRQLQRSIQHACSDVCAARAVIERFSEPVAREPAQPLLAATARASSSPFLEGSGPFGAVPCSATTIDLTYDGTDASADLLQDLPPPPFFVLERMRGLQEGDISAVVIAYPNFENTIRAMCLQSRTWLKTRLAETLALSGSAEDPRILRVFAEVGRAALLPRVPSWLDVCLGTLSSCASGPDAQHCRDACARIVLSAAVVSLYGVDAHKQIPPRSAYTPLQTAISQTSRPCTSTDVSRATECPLPKLLRRLAVSVSELGRGAPWGDECNALVSLCSGLAGLGSLAVRMMHDMLVFDELSQAVDRYDGLLKGQRQVALVSRVHGPCRIF